MSVLIKHMAMPKGCIYANDKDQTDYCPMLNHDDVPFCQYIENEPESAIGIDERPVYCPLSDVPDTNVGDMIHRQAAIDAAVKMFEAWYGGSVLRDREIRARFDVLPSAQPEVIRCGQCKYAKVADPEDSQDGYTCQFHRGSIWFSGSYCSWAERREENE